MSAQQNALSTVESPRPTAVVAGGSLVSFMAARHNLEPQKFLSTLIKTVFPSGAQTPSNEQVAAFLAVAKQYDLNPFIKEIYAFPGKGGGIIPIVSIDGWCTLINRQPALDGIDFEDQFDEGGSVRAITTIIYRKDRSHPTRITEYMAECSRNTEPWTKWPVRMLRHKSLIQCARVAFGLAGIFDPDEAERIAAEDSAVEAVTVNGDSKSQRLAAQLQAQQAEAVDIAPESTVEIEDQQTSQQKQSVDKKKDATKEKAQAKVLRDKIKTQYAELDWDEAQQDKFQGGRDINAYSVAELEDLNNSLTEQLANT